MITKTLRIFLCLASLSCLLINIGGSNVAHKEIINYHFFANTNGEQILKNIDSMIAEQPKHRQLHALFYPAGPSELENLDYEGNKKETPEIKPSDVLINNLNKNTSSYDALWNNTIMIFGANADGIGIGTGFALLKSDNETATFVTAFHVIDQFCAIPPTVISFQVGPDNQAFLCNSLFALHDVTIDTRSNKALPDGSAPWKSQINSITYFDKKLDLAIFEIKLPSGNNITSSSVQTNYNVLSPTFHAQSASIAIERRHKNDEEPPEGLPLTKFDVYLVAYSAIFTSGNHERDYYLIKKRAFQGNVTGTRTYENDQKRGFIQALHHTIDEVPGTSGGPLALTDGRIIGVNVSTELVQFYAKSGCSAQKLESHSSNIAIPSTYLTKYVSNIGATQ